MGLPGKHACTGALAAAAVERARNKERRQAAGAGMTCFSCSTFMTCSVLQAPKAAADAGRDEDAEAELAMIADTFSGVGHC